MARSTRQRATQRKRARQREAQRYAGSRVEFRRVEHQSTLLPRISSRLGGGVEGGERWRALVLWGPWLSALRAERRA